MNLIKRKDDEQRYHNGGFFYGLRPMGSMKNMVYRYEQQRNTDAVGTVHIDALSDPGH